MGLHLDRRQFLQAAAGTGLTVLFRLPSGNAANSSDTTTFSPNAQLSIHADGRIVVHIEKAEMGQGVTTALSQIVAEELEANWDDVTFELNTYTVDHGFVFTASSLSIYTSFDPVSRAAAAARMMLIEAAAAHWGVPVPTCHAAMSHVACDNKRLSYGDIVRLQPAVRTLTDAELAAIELKRPQDYRIIGTPTPSPHHDLKTRGALRYGIDKSLPGMRYAKVAYPPSPGARHRTVDSSAASQVRGYIRTVVDKHVVAVVADSYLAAVEARDALTISWDEGSAREADSDRLREIFRARLETDEGRPWVRRGDAASALSRADKTLERDYTTELVAHLQMEPYNATADFTDGKIHLYCGTQYPTRLAAQVAEWCEIAPEDVYIHGEYMGGGFGALLETEWHAQAAVIAKAIGGPVKLVLSREEDTANDCFRSPTSQKLTCGLTDGNAISGWEHRVVSAWPSSRHSVFLDQKGFDSYALSGSDHHYDIADQHVRAIEHDLGVNVGYVRGVACGYMFFAIESFIDEIAHETGDDPLAFRLKLLHKRPRLAQVLNRAAERGGWGRPQPAHTGLGLAAITAQDSSHNTTRIGACAQARVDPETGAISVERVSCVVDCGIVINPNGAMAMAEGALLYGLSIALKGGGTLRHGRIEERNFDSYPVLRMSEVPELDIEFVINSSDPATGMGEPTMGCIAPALANAVFAATGARVRELPMTPTRVLRAMAT